MKRKGIGFELQAPAKKCSDKNCPFHGKITVRGRVFKGKVISDRMAKTVTVEWTRKAFVPKYERYEIRRSSVKAHSPDCISAKKGDWVMISETKPLSKTKHFVVVQVLGKESKKQAVKSELLHEGEVPDKQKELPDGKQEKGNRADQLDDAVKPVKPDRQPRKKQDSLAEQEQTAITNDE